MIDIMSASGELLMSVPILKDAVVREELMTDDFVRLVWNSDRGDVLPVGCYIVHNNERYTLVKPYAPSLANEGSYKYSPQFDSRVARWKKALVPIYTYEADGKTVKSREFDWTFTGTPDNAMFMIQQAILNETGEIWAYSIDGGMPETITISSQSSSIWGILSEIAECCNTEWWARKNANSLTLGKCEHGSAVSLQVGHNIQTPSVTGNAEEYHTRFYAFGSTRNITQEDRLSSGSIVNKRLTLDPVKFPNGYKDAKGHFENGVFVSDLKPEEVFPTTLYFEDVYPSSKLAISDVRRRLRYRLDENDKRVVIGGTEENPEYETYAIWYFQVPELDFSEQMLIEGLDLSVHFKSGQLRGREFALVYHESAKKIADDRDVDAEFEIKAGDFEIIFDEQSENFIIPSVDYIIPQNGDEVTFFNIKMPSNYVASAYAELESEVDKEIERRDKDNNSYEFSSNPVAFYEDGVDVALGQRVEIDRGGVVLATRVQMVEKHLDYTFDQRIRVGNERIAGSRQQLRDELREVGKEVDDLNSQSSHIIRNQQRHSRQFSTVQETIGMLEKAMLSGFNESISPITIRTMSMLVGDESLQFRFVDNAQQPTQIPSTVRYDKTNKEIVSDGDIIQHMTLGIDNVSPHHDISEYKFWHIGAAKYCVLEDEDKAYYLYIKARKDMNTAEYVVSQSAIGMEAVDGYYHFLTAILNRATEDGRSIAFLNGFTEVLPSQITTDVIRSADGETYFDLAQGEIGGTIHIKAGSKGLENIIDDVTIGGQNLLRNSGFTGDYLSERLADETVLDATSQMENSPLSYWSESEMVTVVADDNSASGFTISMTEGSALRQTLHTPTIGNENYVFTLKAKGDAELSLRAGGGVYTFSVTSDSFSKYKVSFVASVGSPDFVLSSSSNVSVCELQLERGTVATSWSNSPFDNSSDRSYYQALKYLSDAIKGTTVIDGGLVLTEQINVGDYDEKNKKWVKMNGGMSGVYESDHDVAFWAGGDANQAIETVMRYADDPTYQPTQEELVDMANFVVTHGGRAILNDAILRGKVYAAGGEFRGKVDIDSPTVEGRVRIDDNGLTYWGAHQDDSGSTIENIRAALGGTCQGASIVAYAPNADVNFCALAALLAIGDDNNDAIYAKGDVGIYQGKLKTSKIEGLSDPILGAPEPIEVNSDIIMRGSLEGLRPSIYVTKGSGEQLELTKSYHTIVARYGTTIKLDSYPKDGQEYKIVCPNPASTNNVTIQSNKSMVLFLDGIERTSFSTKDLGATRYVVEMVFSSDMNKWLVWYRGF